MNIILLKQELWRNWMLKLMWHWSSKRKSSRKKIDLTEAGVWWKPRYFTAHLKTASTDCGLANQFIQTCSSSHRLHRHRRWWGIPGPRCGGVMVMEVGRSCWRKGDGRWERESAPLGWGCCWGSAGGWWPAACDPSLPSACASVDGQKHHLLYQPIIQPGWYILCFLIYFG